MILQYKGFNNNWCFEEADIITSAVVWVGKETRDYRKGGKKYKPDDLAYMDELHTAVNRLIAEETHCADGSGDIVYHTYKSMAELENVVVVMLADRNKYITHVFENGTNSVYLLNSKGQTVQKLA